MDTPDSVRDNLITELYCSKHPKQRLTISRDRSEVGASSASEVNVRINVHPCRICQLEMREIKEAIKLINSFNDGSI